MNFYNSLTRRQEAFQPLQPGKVGLYTCGPTVYNFAHIGNIRAYTYEDVLRRALIFDGMRVTQVMNLTDVEKNNPIGSAPEVCAFNFDGANKVGSPATAFGDIRYRPDAGELYKVFLTFDGKEYGSDQPLDTAVVRESNQVRFNRTTLTATDGSANTLRVSGVVPMRSNRPSGC